MEFINTTILICSLITGVAAVVALFVSLGNKVAAPNRNQNHRIEEIERRLDRHDDILAKDNRRLENIENGNRYTQRALLALLSHGIDGNEVEAMKRAKDELTNFLIEG